jgi:hypothetical protein
VSRFPDVTVANAAAELSLGDRQAVSRNWRTLPGRVGWVVLGGAAVLGTSLPYLGQILLGLAVVPVVALAVLAYLFLVAPKGGRRWFVRYEHGFVEAGPDGPVRAARWTDVEQVVPEPGGPVLVVSGRVPAFPYPGQRALEVAIQRQVQPLVLDRARAALRDAGRASFGPLTVTPDGLQRADGTQLPWDAVDSHRRAGDRLSIVDGRTYEAWFDGVVPDAIAGDQLLSEADPRTAPPGRPASLYIDDEPVRLERRRLYRSVAVLVVLALLPAVAGYASRPDHRRADDLASYHDMCLDPSIPYDTAAAYTPGAGSHPVAYFELDESGVATKPKVAQFEEMPQRWQTTDPAQVQVVACLDTPTTTFVKTCDYEQIGTQNLTSPDYRITFYEARTGRVITTAHLTSLKHDCPSAVLVNHGVIAGGLRLPLTSDQLVNGLSQALGYQ